MAEEALQGAERCRKSSNTLLWQKVMIRPCFSFRESHLEWAKERQNAKASHTTIPRSHILSFTSLQVHALGKHFLPKANFLQKQLHGNAFCKEEKSINALYEPTGWRSESQYSFAKPVHCIVLSKQQEHLIVVSPTIFEQKVSKETNSSHHHTI